MRQYAYLGIVALLALVVLAITVRLMPRLNRPSRRRPRTEILLLLAMCGVALFVIYGRFYIEHAYFSFGRGDIGSDTYEQYIPFYVNLIGNVRDGSVSLWNFEYDLGSNMATYQSWLLDPFNLFLIPFVLVVGNTHLSLGLVLAQSIKIVLSALLFDHLLTRYVETPLARILGSLMYAFSGFMVLYGQHYWLGSAYPVFTLAVLLFEIYLERGGWARFLACAAVSAVLIGWSPYLAFMALLFIAIYLLFRIPVVRGRLKAGEFALQVLRMALPVLCGGLIACITLLPYAWYLLDETARTNSDTALPQRVFSGLTGFIDPGNLMLTLSRMLGVGLVSNGSSSIPTIHTSTSDIPFDLYEYIMLGYGAAIFLLLSQFAHWAVTEADRRTKKLIAIAAVLIVLFCVNRFLPLLFNALVKVQYRSSFVLNVPICCAAAIGWEKRIAARKAAWAPLIIATGATLVILAWSALHAVNGQIDIAIFAGSVFACIGCIAILNSSRLGSPQRGVLISLLVGCTLISTVFDCFNYTNRRILISKQDFPMAESPTRDADTLAALSYLRQKDPSFYRVDKLYAEWTPLNDSLIQHFDGASAYNSSRDGDIEEFHKKLWYDSIVPYAAHSQGFKNDSNEPLIAQLLGIKYVLAQAPLDYPWLTLERQIGSVYIYRSTVTESIASVMPLAVSEDLADSMPSAADRRELLNSSVIAPADAIPALSLPDEASTEPFTTSSAFQKASETHITGEITSSRDAVVCLALPHTATWDVTVDGNTVETFRADYGFIGFKIPAGAHKVEATYHLAFLREGAALSLVGIIATAGSTIAIAIAGQKAHKGTGKDATARHMR